MLCCLKNAIFFKVYRVNRRSGQVEFGMVVENSELYSSDEEESNEEQQQDQRGRQRQSRRDGGDDDDDDSRLKKGFVRVAWYPKGDEQVTISTSICLIFLLRLPMTLCCSGGEGKPTDTLRPQFDARGCCKEAGEEQRYTEGIL